MNISIYTLSDPQTNEIRYVGQTERRPQLRLTEHMSPSRIYKDYNSNWLRYLKNKNIRPVMDILESFPDQTLADDSEIFHIEYFRSIGCRLTNQTGGGRGTIKNVVVTQKMRDTSRALHLGKKRSPETCKRISEARRGCKLSKPRSQEYREKMSRIHSGKINSLESRIKMSRGHGGRPIVCVETGEVFETVTIAADTKKVWRQDISKILKGKRRFSKGFSFKYLEAK